MKYLDKLNLAQKEAVLQKDGPLLIVAGAGAGKTRTIAFRILHLMTSGVHPESILAVTFTNKAAQEMRERIKSLIKESGVSSLPFAIQESPFVGTFHSLGVFLLRQEWHAAGIRKNFSIADRSQSLSLIREALRLAGFDPKQFEPARIQGAIGREKGELRTAEGYRERVGSDYFRTVIASVWPRYEKLLQESNALDFEDLLGRPVALLLKEKEVREKYQKKWQYIHVDEYQDTNHAQYMLARILAEKHKNICVVGDSDQCLVAGTSITMADRSRQAIESVKPGDMILSNYGSGDFRPARVSEVFVKPFLKKLIQIKTRDSATLVSTPEHMHFAGYRLGLTPQLYFTYLMKKYGVGWRLGVSQTYTQGQKKRMVGFQQRCNQEHGDAVWIIGVFKTPQEARVFEYTLSLRYSIPTLPFVARKGLSKNGYVHDQKMINHIFSSFDTKTMGKKLLRDFGLTTHYPHHRAQSTKSNRRNLVVTLCGDRRGATPMHRIAVIGNDIEGKKLLEQAGFSVRRAKRGSQSWRFESARAHYAELHEIILKVQSIFPDIHLVEMARLGDNKNGPKNGNSLPFLPASSLLPGMALFNECGAYDLVENVEYLTARDTMVYDMNVEKTHNFIANGIVTHNSIYSWRGANIKNILHFEKDYPGAKIVFLEENYRSSATIVAAAGEAIRKNALRIDKKAFTKNEAGEKISFCATPNESGEALFVASKAREIIERGGRAEDIAVLYRANFQSRVLEETFLALQIPYQVVGIRFFERKEVRDIISFVRAAENPESLHDIKRIINVPPRGIGKVTLLKIFAGQKETLPPEMRKKITNFYSFLDKIRERSAEKMPSELIKFILDESGIKEQLSKEGEDGKERLENIRELVTIASLYNSGSPHEMLQKFLENAALASDQDSLLKESRGVRFMTVHASKGLEFETVFITGLEQGLFPHEYLGDEQGGMGGTERAEEERRLFYVALTRAAKKIFLSLAEQRTIFGKSEYTIPSEFLGDIPAHLLEYEEESVRNNVDLPSIVFD